MKKYLLGLAVLLMGTAVMTSCSDDNDGPETYLQVYSTGAYVVNSGNKMCIRDSVADQHIHFGLLLRLCLLDRGGTDRGQQEAAVRIQLGQLCAVFALHQDADKVVRHPHHLLDLGYNAVSAQVGGLSLIHI